MKTLKGSRQLAITLLSILVILLISLSWALADTSPSLEEWNRTLGGSQDDFGMSFQGTSDGGYIIVGHTRSFGDGGRDVYLVKVDSQGMETWNRTFGGSGHDFGMSVQETSDGGYIIAGHTPSFGAGEGDVYLVKTNSQGRETWNRTFGGSQDDWGYSIQETSDGGYIITGSTMSSGAGEGDVYLVKVDSQGMETWSTTFGGSQDDSGYSVQETSDGGYIIVGHTMSFGLGSSDVYLVKVDSQGRETWSRTFGGAQDDLGYSIHETSDGGYVLSGYTMSFGAGGRDVYLVKVDQGGEEETYTASIVDIEAPSEVYPGESFTVEVTVSYEFTFPTEINAGIKEVETETWITGDPEAFVGEGTKTYRFELTAPEEETKWAIEAGVGYNLEGEWTRNEVGSSDVFEISVVEEEGGGGSGIPGFPYLSIAMGLILVLLLRDRLRI